MFNVFQCNSFCQIAMHFPLLDYKPLKAAQLASHYFSIWTIIFCLNSSKATPVSSPTTVIFSVSFSYQIRRTLLLMIMIRKLTTWSTYADILWNNNTHTYLQLQTDYFIKNVQKLLICAVFASCIASILQSCENMWFSFLLMHIICIAYIHSLGLLININKSQ